MRAVITISWGVGLYGMLKYFLVSIRTTFLLLGLSGDYLRNGWLSSLNPNRRERISICTQSKAQI